MATRNQNDFKVDELVKSDQHQKDIGDLDKRIKAIEDKLGTNECIANSFSEAAETQVKIQNTITTFIIRQISENADVQKAITNHINKSDRAAIMVFLKRIGIAGWTLIIAIAGVVLGYILR